MINWTENDLEIIIKISKYITKRERESGRERELERERVRERERLGEKMWKGV